MRGPHPGSQPFAGNVSQGNNCSIVDLLHCEEVTGKVSHRKDFTGDFNFSETYEPWCTQSTVYLSGFKDGCV
jgi:hypothetical protein